MLSHWWCAPQRSVVLSVTCCTTLYRLSVQYLKFSSAHTLHLWPTECPVQCLVIEAYTSCYCYCCLFCITCSFVLFIHSRVKRSTCTLHQTHSSIQASANAVMCTQHQCTCHALVVTTSLATTTRARIAGCRSTAVHATFVPLSHTVRCIYVYAMGWYSIQTRCTYFK